MQNDSAAYTFPPICLGFGPDAVNSSPAPTATTIKSTPYPVTSVSELATTSKADTTSRATLPSLSTTKFTQEPSSTSSGPKDVASCPTGGCSSGQCGCPKCDAEALQNPGLWISSLFPLQTNYADTGIFRF